MSDVSLNIRLLGNRVLIDCEKDSEEEIKTASGLLVSESDENISKTSKRGTVVAVGPGAYEYGELIPMSVSVGDKVLFMFGETIIIGGKTYYLARQPEIHAVLNPK